MFHQLLPKAGPEVCSASCPFSGLFGMFNRLVFNFCYSTSTYFTLIETQVFVERNGEKLAPWGLVGAAGPPLRRKEPRCLPFFC